MMVDTLTHKPSDSNQLWTLICKISGNFSLVREEFINSSNPPFLQLRKVTLIPILNDKKEQTGAFELRIEYVIGSQAGDPPSNRVADTGRDILGFYLDLLAFLSGHNVMLLEMPRMVHKRQGTNKSRAIFLATQQANLTPPMPLTYTSIFAIKMEPKLRRILTWLRKALQDNDVVDSFISLCTASELLCHQIEFNKSSSRKCKNCGYEELINPSTRQRLIYFSSKQLGVQLMSLRIFGSFEMIYSMVASLNLLRMKDNSILSAISFYCILFRV